ncbi:hypothetical protein GCM10023069_16830 [Shinella granuli]
MLQVKAACPRHPDIENQAPGPVGKADIQEFGGGWKAGNVEPDGFHEFLQGIPDARVVIDDENQRTIRNDGGGGGHRAASG